MADAGSAGSTWRRFDSVSRVNGQTAEGSKRERESVSEQEERK